MMYTPCLATWHSPHSENFDGSTIQESVLSRRGTSGKPSSFIKYKEPSDRADIILLLAALIFLVATEILPG